MVRPGDLVRGVITDDKLALSARRMPGDYDILDWRLFHKTLGLCLAVVSAREAQWALVFTQQGFGWFDVRAVKRVRS